MHTVRQLLWVTSTLLFAELVAACSASAVPAGANPASVPTMVPSAAAPMARATASALPAAASNTVAPESGWRELGRLVPNSADGPAIATLAIDPTTPTTLYAGTLYTVDNHIGVYRSSDAGASWQPAGHGLPTSTDGTGVEELTIDPQHSATLYATGHFDGVWRSDDGGMSWRVTGLKSGSVAAFALDPRTPATLYALTSDGLQRSSDGGASWQPIGGGLPAHTDVAFLFLRMAPQQPDTLYLGASFGGVFRSTDAGQHWSAFHAGLPDQPVIEGLALDLQHSGRLYTSITGAGLYRSMDGGQQWSQASDQEYLAITPAGGDTLYAVLNSALARSTDRGTTWHPVADVACGVQALASTLSGGVMVGCLDGRLYAWQATQPSVPSSAAPTADQAVPTAVPTPVATDAKTMVLNAARALGHAGPYHIATTITRDGAIIQIAHDVVPPDREHYAITTPDGVSESITIGNRSYTKSKGAWIAAPSNGFGTPRITDSFREDVIQNIADVTLVGSDTVNGLTAQVYVYTIRAGDQSSTSKLWINIANGLPIKMDIDTQLNGSPVHGTELLTYDPSITIEAPSK